jgi:CheY-like chemotaxis protein
MAFDNSLMNRLLNGATTSVPLQQGVARTWTQAGTPPPEALVPEVAPAGIVSVAFGLPDRGHALHEGLHVLLVDDCPFQRLLACTLLSRWMILPELASDGMEAVLRASEQDFDIILMDIQMPVMDGLTATLRIRRDERARRCGTPVPVVAHTSDNGYDEALWVHCGINAVLCKPCAAFEMGECLERWCGHKFAATHH